MHLSCNSVCICAMLIWSACYCADYYSKNWHTQSCLRWGRMGFPGGAVVKKLPANSGDAGSIPGSGGSPEGGNGNPLQYSCLRNPMDRGSWQAAFHGVAKSRTQLSIHTGKNRWGWYLRTRSVQA